MKLKSFVGAVTAAALITSSAFAADITPANAPLPAGKPAGAKEAALLGPLLIPALLAAAVGIYIGISASGGFNDKNSTPNTSGFQTTP